MKTLGLIGGTGWVSTIDYYRLINQGINKALGGHEFARCIIYSINFGDIVACNEQNDMGGVYTLVKDATEKVINAGAEGIVLCANSLHKFANKIQKEINVPVIHIAEATAREISNNKISTVGLLGTKYTMEENFFTSKLEAANINPVIPEIVDRKFINETIYNELVKEVFKDESKRRFLQIMKKLQQKGAEGIILGCTEIPLFIQNDDINLPLFNTSAIHARAAVDFTLEN